MNDISFVEDTLDIFIGIKSVSKDIQKKINEAVEIAKDEYLWSKTWKETKTELSLWVKVKNKEISYCISADIVNLDDGDFTGANIDVGLSEYQNELKKVIVKAMMISFSK